MLDTPKGWYYLCFLILFVVAAITWILFARLSMARIERDIKNDGFPAMFTWDGLGGRISFFAYAIVFPERIAMRIERLIDVQLVRRYASNADWWRGLFFIVATHLWIVSIFAGIAIGID